ncbi:hypothetical protein BDN70DRAFT_928160 [Pholiota conissans]|uniref:Uncharacterized protein n=1 Tax=Pholiota conissans TaxID=109636 RepID=A0A9P6CY03_9AGAR|nr:hypothetical protein BDN70DRAFT_928160 [Pholiota conissans]
MFEEICLVCGKHLKDDGRAYCSDDCQNSDLSSPSISSSSSALSSPNIGYAAGGDVPALMPSALGTALNLYAGRSKQYGSSSSASSASWSILDDDDDDTAQHYVRGDHAYHDATDPLFDISSKSPNFVYAINPAALSYARRPSGTNTHSTVPHLHHRRLSSGSSSSHVRGIPRSAPLSSATRDDDYSIYDYPFSSADSLDMEDTENHSEKDWGDLKPKYPGSIKSKRSRNRASLPACFSLLQMSSPGKDFRASPVLSSSGNTIARVSPPTPKLPISTGLSLVHPAPSVPPQSLHSTPRGRRHEADNSRSSRRSGSPDESRSRSRARRIPVAESPKLIERNFWDVEDCGDGLFQLPRRGRKATRRNSSPPAFDTVHRRSMDADRSRSRSGSANRPRGRARVEDLGNAMSSEAPGYGNGRSGLVHRERGMARIAL